MKELSKDDLLKAVMGWKTKCGKGKPPGNCDSCDLIVKKIAERLMFGELDHALVKKANFHPQDYVSVALSEIKDIKDKDKNSRSKKLGEELVTLLAKMQQSMEKQDLINNLKDTKIDGKPS